jgi:hypothetical protein
MQLKNNILQRLAQINDADSLKQIYDLINKLHSDNMEMKERYPFLGNVAADQPDDKENFNEYIKEWIRQM